MANTFASINNALGILKIYYAGPIVTQFNDEIPLYRAAEKGKEKWNGLQVNRPLKVGRNPGIGATSDGGALPSIGKQSTIQAQIAARFNYLRFGVTGPMLKASQGDKGSFISIMEYEMSEGLNDLKNDVNRQLFWDGTGKLAELSANAVATATITVSGRSGTEAGDKYLEIGQVIDIYTAAGSLVVSGRTVTAITSGSIATVVLDAPVTANATDIIVRAGAYGQEMQGIVTLLDGASSTVYGVNRSLYKTFNGNYVDASGAQLSLDLMQRTLNRARQQGGKHISAIFCDYDSERFYTKLLVADKRYIGEKVKGDGSFTDKEKSYLEFGGAPVTPDKDCPGNNFFFMPAQGWKKYVLCELEWSDETGSYMIAQTGTDAFEARLRLFANMFPEKPSTMARLTNFVSP
jgi:hypothetical protein